MGMQQMGIDIVFDCEYSSCTKAVRRESRMREVTTTVRLPADMMTRIEALVPVVEQWPEFAVHGRVSRSAVIRLLLLRGLEAVEAETKGKRGRGR